MLEYRKLGKQTLKKYGMLRIKKFHDFLAFLLGIFLTIAFIVPFVLILVSFYKLFRTNVIIKSVIIVISWLLLCFSNGLSNYLTILIIKGYYKENPEVNSLKPGAVFFYQLTNIWFALFSLVLMLVVMFLW